MGGGRQIFQGGCGRLGFANGAALSYNKAIRAKKERSGEKTGALYEIQGIFYRCCG